ncbi:MAG: hypothetical protein KY451_03715 [Actinobacteria bacterium]|nr:hypothetical protein [Actinomycetota bacterium]
MNSSAAMSGIVSPSMASTVLMPSQVSKLFIALSQAAGLPGSCCTACATHATHALAAGVPITVVANWLGHSRSSFTADTYTRVLP